MQFRQRILQARACGTGGVLLRAEWALIHMQNGTHIDEWKRAYIDEPKGAYIDELQLLVHEAELHVDACRATHPNSACLRV